ncbi:MAG TPA: DUF6194 family protein [Lapillicoccus sp.]
MTEDELLAVARGMDGVTVVTSSEETGAPEVAWGDSFVYYDPPGTDPETADRRFPFATVVVKDYPGFDEASQLDRDGVFRVNVNVGRRRFEELVGYPPSQHGDRRDAHDYAAVDTVLPHPAYGQQAWVSVVNPGERTSDLVRTLLVDARDRTAARHR